MVKPRGPHHWATCLGSVQASQTVLGGASKKRVSLISLDLAAVCVVIFSFLLTFLMSLSLNTLRAGQSSLPRVSDRVPSNRRRLSRPLHLLRTGATGRRGLS